jgi:hypothetical protein
MGYSGSEIDNIVIDTLDDNVVRFDMLTQPDQVKRLDKKVGEMRNQKKILCLELQRNQDQLKNQVYKE